MYWLSLIIKYCYKTTSGSYHYHCCYYDFWELTESCKSDSTKTWNEILGKKTWNRIAVGKTLLWNMTNNSSVWVKKPIIYHKHLRTIQFGGFSLGWPPVTNRGYCCSSFWPIRKPVVVLLQLVLLFLQPQQNLEVVNILLMVQGTNISHQYEKESLIFPTAFSPNISGT